VRVVLDTSVTLSFVLTDEFSAMPQRTVARAARDRARRLPPSPTLFMDCRDCGLNGITTL
jgi:hypothetical protein